MKNMTTMARSECAELPEERDFMNWLSDVRAAFGTRVELDVSDREGIAWDLFRDGATPEDAAAEIRADKESRAAVACSQMAISRFR